MAKKLAKGKFDLDDLSDQLGQMEKMGGMEGLMGLLPGVQKIKKQIAEANISDRMIMRQRAIIGSMTKQERKKPDILQASRKRRIAAGAGVDVAEINRLLKQHRQMQDAFKFMAKDGGKDFARMAAVDGRRRHGPAEGHGRRPHAGRRRAGQPAARTRRSGANPSWPRRARAAARHAARPRRRRLQPLQETLKITRKDKTVC